MDYKTLIEVLQILPEQAGMDAIYEYISQNENIIPSLLQILSKERKEHKKIIGDANERITYSTFAMMVDNKSTIQDMINKNKKFYEKYAGRLTTSGLKLWDDLS